MSSPHISEYMTSGPFAIAPGEPLDNARRLMEKYELRHLPVWSGGALVGIVSDRDLDLVQTLASIRPAPLTVEEAMTPDPYAPSPDTPLIDVVRVMIERKIGSAVVVDAGQIVGIFTAMDAMRALVDALGGKLSPVFDSATSSRTRPQAARRRRDAR